MLVATGVRVGVLVGTGVEVGVLVATGVRVGVLVGTGVEVVCAGRYRCPCRCAGRYWRRGGRRWSIAVSVVGCAGRLLWREVGVLVGYWSAPASAWRVGGGIGQSAGGCVCGRRRRTASGERPGRCRRRPRWRGCIGGGWRPRGWLAVGVRVGVGVCVGCSSLASTSALPWGSGRRAGGVRRVVGVAVGVRSVSGRRGRVGVGVLCRGSVRVGVGPGGCMGGCGRRRRGRVGVAVAGVLVGGWRVAVGCVAACVGVGGRVGVRRYRRVRVGVARLGRCDGGCASRRRGPGPWG